MTDAIERTEIAAAEPTVLAARIFGSRGRGEGRRGSDLDVAVLANGGNGNLADRIAGDQLRGDEDLQWLVERGLRAAPLKIRAAWPGAP